MELEPEYSFEHWALAGVTESGRYRATVRQSVSADGYSRGAHVVTVERCADRSRTRQAVDIVRRTYGANLTAAEALPIVRATAAMLTHPDAIAARAAVANIPSDGTVPKVQGAPDPYTARDHDSQITRSRKAGASFIRRRVGMASVIGRTATTEWSGHADGATPEAMALRESAAERAHSARRTRVGAVSLDLQHAADETYREHGLPAMVGSDVTAWSATVPGDRSSRCSVAQTADGLSGWADGTETDRFAAHSDVYAPQTDRVDWPMRVTVPKGRKRKGDPTDRVIGYGPVHTAVLSCTAEPFSAPTLCTRVTYYTRTACVAPGPDTDHRFVGHSLVKRRTVVKRDRNAERKRNADRTVGTVDAPTTREGWATLLEMLNRGERIKCKRTDGAVLTIVRNKQRYTTRGTVDGARIVWHLRTVDAMSMRLASLDI